MANKILNIKTEGNTDIIDITDEIKNLVEKEKVNEGFVNIFVKGSTASITTIEADENLYEDLREVLEELAPVSKDWKHHKTWGDDNGSAHIRAAIFGPSISVPIIEGRLYLGTWQRIVLIDFDTSPRSREVVVKIIKS